MVPLAIGTDGGGSIRIPSAFCGTAGLKPTFGLIPKMPGFRGWPTLSVNGPIATDVRDLALAATVMAGPSSSDPLSYPSPSGDDLGALDEPGWAGLRVAFSADLGFAGSGGTERIEPPTAANRVRGDSLPITLRYEIPVLPRAPDPPTLASIASTAVAAPRRWGCSG